DLRQLDAFAGRVVEKGFGSERTEIRGSTEIAGLARSINHMLDRLHEQHARLRDESEKLHQLANTILPLAWMANPDGWIHWYNDRWYAYTGTTPEQMKGWGWQSAHHPDYLPKVMEKWQESIATGETFQMTFPLRGADGNYRTFFTLAAPLKDAEGRIVHWFGTNTDISTLEEAERAVRESEERLNEGLVAARMAVWDWALDSGAIRMSANTHELLGREFTTARQFWETLHPDDYPRIRSAVEEARKGDHRFKEIVRVRRADSDEYIWVEIRGKFVFDESGAPYSLRGVAIDITERKRAEEALQAANKRKDEFLAMLAHELRNPLAPISMSAEILKWSNGDEKRVKNVSEVIGRQVAHMSSLLDDLLDVSRVTRGLITLNREPALLGQIVENAAEQAAPLIKTRRHELTIVNDAADAVIYADQIRMVQVVTNLLNNAAKYTEEGGAILLETRREGNQAVIAVRDNGIGIAPDLLPHVFELFTQAERSPDRSQGGLGLGLALVKSLVELHGGSVSAFSKGPGQGSEFRVVLPLAVSTRAVSQPANAIASRVGERCLRIMIVDDNQDAADSLATLLDAEKHVITTCYHPNDALNAAAEEEFDAFIIDIGLPYIDGYELGSRLRRETANANALFIALTGYGDQHAVQQSAAAGFSHHFVKPVKFTTLLAALGGLNAAVDGEEKE
ncbi:MAG: hypothetical protein K0S28_1897, partial [Paucimonas sp.]|nr:hypothetical protein [Paucimonas sp.]